MYVIIPYVQLYYHLNKLWKDWERNKKMLTASSVKTYKKDREFTQNRLQVTIKWQLKLPSYLQIKTKS